ncbi:uncharacterized protein LY89DRAFT_36290 [Mollisia scopiformis]|uniref:Uncharacterized protein n=1 Tax=Mollisia scopiformis TaxID=149040 RepID=A0A194XD20_MOLSC|nr:uncharacterized protein LY89DRAFT_36290 [Mollisia scopiformis]KUJ18054.1 hypothetical protein LY89DRAFT_36290 [Mollisia scopiformis]
MSRVNNFPAFSSIPSGVKRIIPSRSRRVPCPCEKSPGSMIREKREQSSRCLKISYFYIYIRRFRAIGYGTVMLLLFYVYAWTYL